MKGHGFMKRLCAFILGAVFLVGGLFKLMDPVGSALVMESYFNFLHIGFLRSFATFAALFFNLLECFVGICLISGIWVRVMRNVTLGLLSLFTVLTLLLLIFNPDMDCGCFGEVVHMTHLQSFLKNIVLLVIWTVAFVPYVRQHYRPLYRKIISGVACVFVAGFGIYSFMKLPLLDLTDLHTGKELEEGMISIVDENGEYADGRLLRGKLLLISSYDPSSVSEESIAEIRRLSRSAGLRSIVAASGDLELEDVMVYRADRRTLMSLNRANPGVSFISGGQIAQKWTAREFLSLDKEELREIVKTDPSELVLDEAIDGRRRFEVFALVLFVMLLF